MFDKYYVKPWCRGAVYFMGLLFGVAYRESKNYKVYMIEQNKSEPLLI